MNTTRMLLVAGAVAAALATAAPATAATKAINIYGSKFSPSSLTVTEGDTVVWTNKDNALHQVLADKGQFVSSILKTNQSYSFQFRAAGTYTYKDELHPRIRGTIYVKGAPPTLVLSVSATQVTFGDKVTLSGQVSSHKPGESVTIYYQPYPQPNMIQRAVVLTGADGTFSFLLSPQVLTTYQAAWKGAFAVPVSVEVRPRLTLGRSGAWLVHAWGARSFAGRGVQFQRLNTSTGQWVTLRLVRLDAHNAARITNITLPKGLNRLRVAMSVNQAGAGYLGSIGSTITWRVS